MIEGLWNESSCVGLSVNEPLTSMARRMQQNPSCSWLKFPLKYYLTCPPVIWEARVPFPLMFSQILFLSSNCLAHRFSVCTSFTMNFSIFSLFIVFISAEGRFSVLSTSLLIFNVTFWYYINWISECWYLTREKFIHSYYLIYCITITIYYLHSSVSVILPTFASLFSQRSQPGLPFVRCLSPIPSIKWVLVTISRQFFICSMILDGTDHFGPPSSHCSMILRHIQCHLLDEYRLANLIDGLSVLHYLTSSVIMTW